MNKEKILTNLQQLGLTAVQSDIYLYLLQTGSSRIQSIATELHIARSSVYEYLKVLQRLELVEELVHHTYKTYRAYPIGQLRHGLQEEQRRLERQQAKVEELEKQLVLVGRSIPPTTVRYYEDRSGARQLLWNTLKATDTVYVYSAWGRGRYVGLSFYEQFVSESANRHIKEQVLINPDERVLESIRTYNGSNISRTSVDDIRALSRKAIAISGETFMYGNIYAQIYLRARHITGFEIESPLFVQTQRSIFRTLWQHAQPVSELL